MTGLTNTLKTAALLATLTVLLVLAGRWFGGTQGMLIAFLLALLMNGGAYWFSDRLALSLAGAREVDRYEAPRLHQMVAQLAQRANLPMPRVYLIDSAAPNAFATGRNPQHGAVAVTTGLLRLLNEDEVACGDRPRVGAYQEPGHVDQHNCGNVCWRRGNPGGYGAVGAAARRVWAS
jgi:heat shock protein HtpX